MLKNILNLGKVRTLKKREQALINGGVKIDCDRRLDCPSGWECSGSGYCFEPECRINSDCPPGYICIDYNCHC